MQTQYWQADTILDRLTKVIDSINLVAGKNLIGIKEVDNYEESQVGISTYDLQTGTGRVTDLIYNDDSQGQKYKEHTDIALASYLIPLGLQYVLLQEFGHFLNNSSEHGDYLDMTRTPAGDRLAREDPLYSSEIESTVWINNTYQPRNWRVKEYSSDFNPGKRKE